MPDTNHEAGLQIANRLCSEIRHMPLQLLYGAALPITVSIGVHTIVPTAQTTWEGLVGAADQAMYRAKQMGRDRVHSDAQEVLKTV